MALLALQDTRARLAGRQEPWSGQWQRWGQMRLPPSSESAAAGGGGWSGAADLSLAPPLWLGISI